VNEAVAENNANAAGKLLEPGEGYDLIASFYEQWRWSSFWRDNEAPIIVEWLQKLRPGVGLDAGSGTGPYLAAAVRCGHRCVALDVSEKMLALNATRMSGSTPSVQYVQGNVTSLPFDDDTFDWILCSRVLSHVRDIEPPLREFARALKRGGEILISDVHPEHPYTNVTIPGRDREVPIKTYKHPLNATEEVIRRIRGLKLRLDQYHLRDLRAKPSVTDFGKLYRDANAPVFYVAWIRKS
jgi:ubiquinone/menaquinone biosynthesis C-methylase UbiE